MMPFAGKIAVGGIALMVAAGFMADAGNDKRSSVTVRYLLTLGVGMLAMAFLLWLGMS